MSRVQTGGSMDFDDQLAAALRSSVATIDPPVTDLVAGGAARGRRLRRRRRLAQTGVALAAVVAVLGGAAAVLLPGSDEQAQDVATGPGCRAVVEHDVLPRWAWAGFSGPDPAVAHVHSEDGEMLAILFGRELSAPPARDRSNKVLWVARDAADAAEPLRIEAALSGTSTVVRRELAGVGPSTVDLPEPGCWHLTLRWGSHTDTIDLAYRAPG